MWLRISKAFSPFCEKLPNDKNCANERTTLQTLNKIVLFWWLSAEWNTISWSLILYFQKFCLLHYVTHLGPHYKVLIQYIFRLDTALESYFPVRIIQYKTSKGSFISGLYKAFNWLWKACGYWIWNHFQICISFSFGDIYLLLIRSLFINYLV